MARPIPLSLDEQAAAARADEQEPVDEMTEIAQYLPAWAISLFGHLFLFLVLALIAATTAVLTPNSAISIESAAGGSEGLDGDGSAPPDSLPSGELGGEGGFDVETPTSELANLTTTPIDDVPKFDLAGPGGLHGIGTGTGLVAGKGHGRGRGRGDGIGDGEGSGKGSGFDPIRTSVFGVATEGKRFVYVFDRSHSMTAYLTYTEGKKKFTLAPLDMAKAELLRSLKSLNDKQQFQIIFYNSNPYVFDQARGKGELITATSEAKRRASAFVQGMTGDGGTSHVEPLKIALKMKPDVIFLLSDGIADDDPDLLSINELTELNQGRTKINVILFSFGPRSQGSLTTLAQRSGGQYLLIDTQLGPPVPGDPYANQPPPPATADQTAEQPAEQTTEQPAEQAAEQTAEQPAEQSQEVPKQPEKPRPVQP